MDQLPEHFEPRGEPLELLHRDTIVLRIARLHIGVLQLLEPRPVSTRLARPSIDKATINTLGLLAEENQIMDMRRVESLDQKYAMVKHLSGLMQVKCRDRKSFVKGKSVSVCVDLGGRRVIKKKN